MSERDASPGELKRLQARFAELVRRHEPMLRRYLAKIAFACLRRGYDVDDLAQETLLEAWTIYARRTPCDNAEEMNADEKVFPRLLLACARHRVRNLARTETRLKRRPPQRHPEFSSGTGGITKEEDHAAALDLSEWRRKIHVALQGIREEDRKLLQTVYFRLEASSYKVIGEEMGLSKTGAQKRAAGAVRRLFREMLRLQTHLSVLVLYSALEPLHS